VERKAEYSEEWRKRKEEDGVKSLSKRVKLLIEVCLSRKCSVKTVLSGDNTILSPYL